ncbi:MAG TPA: SprT-like domain-containing protein [Candidatus Methylomirabilis sp.]|nr:SprT-like domain-containing protein [Candidatus Methylomirabilis sp.]
MDDTHLQLTLELVSANTEANDVSAVSPESRLLAAVEACYRRAEIHFRRRFERPRLAFNLRGMAAAVAHTTGNAIRINRPLLERNIEDFLGNTVPHEVSHLLAHRLHGPTIAPHGAQWAAIMREVFGLEPRRCHDYDVRPGMTAAYRYHCSCPDGHTLGTRRHRNALRGRRYYCRRCRQPLRFAHAEKRETET